MMKMLLLVVTVFLSSIVSARPSYSEWSDSLIQSIHENEASCVDFYEGDKIYLNSDMINATEQGICLNVNDQRIVLLPLLVADKRGCFVLSPYQRMLKTCSSCGKKYYINCINTRCTFSKKTPSADLREWNRDQKY